jgi:integrase
VVKLIGIAPRMRWVTIPQRMLGHAKASMTLDTYADLFDTDLDAVAVELDAAIRAAIANS